MCRYLKANLSLILIFVIDIVTSDTETWSIPGQRVSYQNLVPPAGGNLSIMNDKVDLNVRISMLRSTLEGKPLLEEVLVLRSLGHFDRERTPERVVHAKGSTFYGTFVTSGTDIARYTSAQLFAAPNTVTRVAVRFSTSLGERGSADTAFGEVRGMAIKFYTEQGNYDMLCINFPIFFINDAQLFAQMTHAQKRDPRTDFRNANNVWDFFSLRPETFNMITLLYSDYGLPDGYRHMSAFSVNAFRLVNKRTNEPHVYAKFIWIPAQGIHNLNLSKAIQLAGEDPDYARRDLFHAIETKRFPKWTLYIQVVSLEEVHRDFTYNPFDATKMWPFDKYPLLEVGTLTITRNVKNAFAENEQIAFNPANLIAGIEPSPDRLLRGRLFSYRDTQFHRLGANHQLIPVNREPHRILSERDGFAREDDNLGAAPNYYPNSVFHDEPSKYGIAAAPFTFITNDIGLLIPDSLEQQYAHARESYRSLSDDERDHLHQNLAFALVEITKPSVLHRVLKHFRLIDPSYSDAVQREMWRYDNDHHLAKRWWN